MDNPSNIMKLPSLSTKNLSLIIMITAINLASNYAMLWIPNVKFMDLFVFISGYVMGAVPGAIVGILTWLIYGTLNPRGFNLPTLAATCVGESLYGIVGGLSAKFGLGSELSSMNTNDDKIWLVNLKFGIIGFLLTFIYDLFTNIVTGIVFGIPLIAVILQGIAFALAHEISNFFFFFFGFSSLVTLIKKLVFMGVRKYE
ncbi:MAG: hypothetical protein QW546_01820 [Candidatus Bathyarchaeia archaeon]